MKVPVFLILLAILTATISGCQSQPGKILTASPVLPVKEAPVVSPERCASANGPLPALDDGLPSEPQGVDITGVISSTLGGGIVQSNEFTIELLLYCNPSFGPASMEPYFLSDIEGLAIYYRWRYDGSVENGSTYIFHGFPPNIRSYKEGADSLRQGQMNGKYSNARGIQFAPNTFPDLSTRTSQRFLYILQGPSGQLSGAALSFDLQQAADGIQPDRILITALTDAELASLKNTLPTVTP